MRPLLLTLGLEAPTGPAALLARLSAGMRYACGRRAPNRTGRAGNNLRLLSWRCAIAIVAAMLCPVGAGAQNGPRPAVDAAIAVYCSPDAVEVVPQTLVGEFVTHGIRQHMVLEQDWNGEEPGCTLTLEGFVPLRFRYPAWMMLRRTCRDPVTRLDHAAVIIHTGGNPDPGMVAHLYADRATGKLAVGYEEYVHDMSSAEPTPDGVCRWRAKDSAITTFHSAIAALRITDRLSTQERLQALPSRTAVFLPSRTLPADRVGDWLVTLALLPLDVVDISVIVDEGGRWTLVRIVGRTICVTPGVVLLHDARTNIWRSIFDLVSGCLNASDQHVLRIASIAGDDMFARLCPHPCRHGDEMDFSIGLESLNAARLPPQARLVIDDLLFSDDADLDCLVRGTAAACAERSPDIARFRWRLQSGGIAEYAGAPDRLRPIAALSRLVERRKISVFLPGTFRP